MEFEVGPRWYQELSREQLTAVDRISEAIEDEIEECQFDRCIEVLSVIGLSPLSKKSEILTAIEFSRGNDIAFLWSLYESMFGACAITHSKRIFSYNERLILSSICHLDMILTLRELDKILPKPEMNKKEKCVRKKIKQTYELPYDEPVPKPKMQPKRFLEPPSWVNPKFELYKNYKNLKFKIKNEESRWFAASGLIPSAENRIARKIICDELYKVVGGNYNRKNVQSSLCEKHRIESSKFNQFMKKMTERQRDDNEIEDKLKDLSMFERGIAYGVLCEMKKIEKECRAQEDNREKQVMMKTILRKLAENAADLKYIHLCKNCENCLKNYQNTPKPIECHQKEPSTVNSQSEDDNQIKFFHRPSPTSPFEFDYEKIFNENFLHDFGVVRNSINAALELDKHLTLDNAITASLRDMWRVEMKLWNEKRREAKEKFVVDWEKIGKNKQKMFGVLKKAMISMQKNPKFVLVSLPESHRLPFLKEWILKRFGIRYDSNFNEQMWKLNKLQQDKLDSMGIVPKVPVPTIKEALGFKGVMVNIHNAARMKPKVK